MNRIKFAIIIFHIFCFANAQDGVTDYEKQLLDKAGTIEGILGYTSLQSLIEQKDSVKSKYAKETKRQILWAAEEYYDKLIDSFPNSKLIYRAILGKAYVNYNNEEFDDAKTQFLRLYETKESLNIGGPNIETSTRFWINLNLAEISIMERDFKKALDYIEESKNHKIQHLCLNAFYENQAHVNYLSAKAYFGLKNSAKAYSLLIPNLFESGCLSDTGIVDLAIEQLLKTYSKDELKKLFEKSFSNAQIETGTYQNKPIDRFYITFLNEKIYLPYYETKKVELAERDKNIRKAMTDSKFYKKLM